MTAPNVNQNPAQIPLKIVGGTHFGRYPKISKEETWNFIVSDGFLVPYAGYKNALTIDNSLAGRGLYSSFRGNMMIAVIGVNVYKITVSLVDGSLNSVRIGSLQTSTGDVYIAENNNAEICITDGIKVYVYQYRTSNSLLYSVQEQSQVVAGKTFLFPFSNPGYISFQNGVLIIACTSSANWVLSGFNAATEWSIAPAFVGSIQTKPDYAQAAVPMPGGGNNLLVFGRTVAELWQFTGNALFPYQRASTFNIDYGCINAASVAHLKNYVVWLSVNEQSGPVLMVSYGGIPESISTDGIDFQLNNLTNPENCTGFLYQQDGHVIYQFTFPDDNISYAYDFETKLFFNVSDENLDYHIAREVVYFNNNYYFVSLNGGNVYEFSTLYPFAEYDENTIREIPRIRITPPLRLPTQRPYIANNLGFTIENGRPNVYRRVTTTKNIYTPIATEDEIDIATEAGVLICIEGTENVPDQTYEYSQSQINLAISRDGGESFGTFVGYNMNRTGHYKSRLVWYRLGRANDATFQLRFNGPDRFVVTDGLVEIYE